MMHGLPSWDLGLGSSMADLWRSACMKSNMYGAIFGGIEHLAMDAGQAFFNDGGGEVKAIDKSCGENGYFGFEGLQPWQAGAAFAAVVRGDEDI